MSRSDGLATPARRATAPADGASERRSSVIGVSLKMYFDPERTVSWCRQVADLARDHEATRNGRVTLFVLPSFPALQRAIHAVAGSPVSVGAQDLFWEDRGPYTGGVSGSDLRQIGCTLVEVGHVERRVVFGEDQPTVRRKLAAALRNGLQPVLCVGEREAGAPGPAAQTALDQLASAVDGLGRPSPQTPLVVAYEPEWAIGADRSATPDHVISVMSSLRDWLDARPNLAGYSLIYGGSAGPGVLASLDGTADGLFLGRFAHDPLALLPVLDEALAIA